MIKIKLFMVTLCMMLSSYVVAAEDAQSNDGMSQQVGFCLNPDEHILLNVPSLVAAVTTGAACRWVNWITLDGSYQSLLKVVRNQPEYMNRHWKPNVFGLPETADAAAVNQHNFEQLKKIAEHRETLLQYHAKNISVFRRSALWRMAISVLPAAFVYHAVESNPELQAYVADNMNRQGATAVVYGERAYEQASSLLQKLNNR